MYADAEATIGLLNSEIWNVPAYECDVKRGCSLGGARYLTKWLAVLIKITSFYKKKVAMYHQHTIFVRHYHIKIHKVQGREKPGTLLLSTLTFGVNFFSVTLELEG